MPDRMGIPAVVIECHLLLDRVVEGHDADKAVLKKDLRQQFGILAFTAKKAQIDGDDQVDLAAFQATDARSRNTLDDDSNARGFGCDAPYDGRKKQVDAIVGH